MVLPTPAPPVDDARVTTAHFRAMGGEAAIHVLVDDQERADGLLRRGAALVADLEDRWSRFRPDSELCRLNRSAGRPCLVSTATAELVALACDAWYATDGRFDPTVEVSMTAAGYDRPLDSWDRTRPVGRPPRPAPGVTGIECDPESGLVLLPVGVTIDLGGVAKGRTADLVAADLVATGGAGVVVEIGGDLRAMGRAPHRSGPHGGVGRGEPGQADGEDDDATIEGWEVDVLAHRPDGGDHVVPLALRSGAVCTSTTLKRRWRGRTGAEHHLRRPSTGGPLTSDLVTVSVVCANATQGEILTKQLMALGLDQARDWLEGTELGALAVTADGQLHRLGAIDHYRAAG